MATVYYADNYQAPALVAPGGWPLTREFSFLVSTAFIINDTVRLMTFPGLGPGIIVDAWLLYVPIIDGGSGSATVTFELGDVLTNTNLPAETGSGSAYTPAANKYMAAVAPSSGAATTYYSQSNGVAGVLPFSYSQFGPNNSGGFYDLQFKITVAPDVGETAVSIKGWVQYHMAGPTPTV